jgi:hypothetical protein
VGIRLSFAGYLPANSPGVGEGVLEAVWRSHVRTAPVCSGLYFHGNSIQTWRWLWAWMLPQINAGLLKPGEDVWQLRGHASLRLFPGQLHSGWQLCAKAKV